MREIWIIINIGKKEVDFLFEVSTKGRVRRIATTIINPRWNNKQKVPRKIIETKLDKHGYVRPCLGYSRRRYLAHRLVALMFIPNPLNRAEVNHINGIRCDNRIENLEWVTKQENIRDAVERIRGKKWRGNIVL